uniref:Sensory transduction protein RegX3 n=1 Tax=Streptomyces antibioticus TaxID=1890 RepID=Q9AMH3_STRAT|nr:putative regulator SimReg1 [Streptomyces antibioticus]
MRERPSKLTSGGSVVQILTVTDDLQFFEELADDLPNRGFQARREDGIGGALTKCRSVDVILVDLAISETDGFEVCRAIRAVSHVPIIVVSARDDELDQILSLKLGADDYIVWPCGMRQLVARMEALIRRARNAWESWGVPLASPEPGVRQFGPVRIDLQRRSVTRDGHEVPLTRKEFDMLALLATDPGRVFTREQIMFEVWGHDGAGDTRTLGVHVTGIRKKLRMPELVETVRGVGFRLANHTLSEDQAAA